MSFTSGGVCCTGTVSASRLSCVYALSIPLGVCFVVLHRPTLEPESEPHMRVVVVGGVAGGMSAAARLPGATRAPRSSCWSAANTCPSRTAGSRTTSAARSKTPPNSSSTPRKPSRRRSTSTYASTPRSPVSTRARTAFR